MEFLPLPSSVASNDKTSVSDALAGVKIKICKEYSTLFPKETADAVAATAEGYVHAVEQLIASSFMMGMIHADEEKSRNGKSITAADEAPEEIPAVPFEKAKDFLASKIPMTKSEWLKLEPKLRFRAFTVSRLADGDMVERVKGLLAQNLEDGSGLKGFLEKTDTEIMNGLGLGGNGGGWYWENVYRTNVQTAYNTGRALGFEAVKPVALELVGIGDMRQTDICRSLTQPPVRRLYTDPFWKTHWPPFHFGCRTTVRAIYDPGELEEKPVTAELTEEKPARGFGTYPVTNGNWWRELASMTKRAKKYGIQKEIETAKKLLVEEIEKGFTTGRSVGAMAQRFYVDTGIPVKADEVFPWHIKEGTTVTGVKVIADGEKIRDINRLRNTYKLQNGKLTDTKDWFKVRGTGIIENDETGQTQKVELHWYFCRNIGKVEFKRKRILQ